MRPRAMTRAAMLGGIAAVATAALLVVGVLDSTRESCEVCMEYRGRSECRRAAGRNREEATRTATDSACGLLGSGRLEAMECARAEPLRVTCSAK